MLVVASVTDSLANFAINVIKDLGLPGIWMLMAINAGGIPIPSEATMLFAGFNVYKHDQTLLGITVAGVLGDVTGCSIAYAIGRFGRESILERHGRKLHLSAERLAKGDHWFDRHGAAFIVVSRFTPVLRSVGGFPAGAARYPYAHFAVLVAIGALPYVLGIGLLGREVGSDWETWRKHLGIIDYVVAGLIVVGIVYLLVRWWRGRGQRPADVAA